VYCYENCVYEEWVYMCTQWAHFPHIHFGLKLDGNSEGKLEQGEGGEKTNGFY